MFSLPETLLGDRVPLVDHLADDVVLTKDNSVLAMFAVDGVYPGTADERDIERWFERVHNTWRNIAAEDIELNFYQCRGEMNRSLYEDGLHTSDFARDLDDAYRENLFQGTLWHNALYFTIQIHGQALAARTASKFIADAGTDPRTEINERKDRLNDLCMLLEVQLKEFGLRRLGYITRGRGLFDEIAEAIVFAMTGVYRQIGATTGRMGHAMFSETIRFRRKRVEFHGPAETTYAQMYGFKEYPLQTWPGMFHSLAMAPYRNTLHQSFRFLSNADAMSKVTRKQNTMLMANDKAASQIEELSHAADDLLGRKYVLGQHSLVLIAFGDDAKAMNEVGNAAWRDLAACGLVATRMSKALQAAFLSMLPGAESWRPRPGFVKSRNLVAFFPFYNWPTGRARAHWPGPPIAHFRTMAGTLFRFHWHVEDLGNTLMTGLPGGGKTLATGFLLANTAGRARIVALDHKRGWQFLIQRLGGTYAVLGAGRASLAPLKALDAQPHNIDFLTTLIRGCIGGEMTEEEGRRLSTALQTVMRLKPELRNMGEVRAFFDGNPEGAGARLEKWCWGNELGWVVDAPVNTVAMTDLMGLDTTQLLANRRARGPAMSVLFHYLDLMLDGTPILIPIDEGWRALEDDVFRPAIAAKIRTIRSKGGVIVFITQSPGDIRNAGIADVLIDMCPTQMHFANPRASKADFIEGLKLTEGQWEAFRPIQPGEGLFLLVQGTQGVVLQLPLHYGMDNYIGVLSAREADLKRADRAAAIKHLEREAA